MATTDPYSDVNVPVSVRIQKDQTIDDLKQAIKARNVNFLTNIDHKDLILHDVNVPVSVDEVVTKKVLDRALTLQPLWFMAKIEEAFQSQPPSPYIVVQLPSEWHMC